MNNRILIWTLSFLLLIGCTQKRQVQAVSKSVGGVKKNQITGQGGQIITADVQANETQISDLGFDESSHADYQKLLNWFKPEMKFMQTLFLQRGIWQTVMGKNGTEITLNTADFEHTDKATGRLRLQLMEFTDKMAAIKAGIQTICSGRPLECLGALYVSLTDGKRNFYLKSGKFIWVKYPINSNSNYGIFYSKLDRLGRMVSESSKLLLETTHKLKNDGYYHQIRFTSDSVSQGSVSLFKIRSNKLLWQRQITQIHGLVLTDTIDYQQFTQHIFSAMGLQTRSYLIPIDQRMVPLENINGAVIYHRSGEKASMMEMHYSVTGSQNLNDFTVLENKPVRLSQTGWVQFSKFLPQQQTSDVRYSSAERGNIGAGIIYFISKRTNTILMNPWLAEADTLPEGKFGNIPSQMPGLLVAIIYRENAYFVGTADVGRSGKVHTLHFEPMPPDFELGQLMFTP